MNKPLVTISIPIYKCEDFLEECLLSVKNQSYENIEVTLIDDQTPDNAVEIAEKFISENNLQNWKIYHLQQNSGLSVVRNKGIDTAQGKYLFFLDSDDTITPDCIQILVDIAEKTQAQMTISQLECERKETGERFMGIKILSEKEVIEGNENIFKEFSEGKLVTYAVNKLLDVQYLRDNKLYFVKGLFAQDELWSFHVYLKINKVAIHKGVTYTYLLHSESVIHNRDKRHFDNWATILNYVNDSLSMHRDKEKYIKTYIVNYKTMTLIMNWKAKQSDEWWMYSYDLFKQVKNLSIMDYFKSDYSSSTKKRSLKLSLPTKWALKLFKKQYYGG